MKKEAYTFNRTIVELKSFIDWNYMVNFGLLTEP